MGKIPIETMKRFLGEETRYDLKKFGFVDGCLIATDGRILIRVPYETKPDGIEYSEKYPNIKGLFATLHGRDEKIKHLSDIIDTKARCENCDGKGKEPQDCGECSRADTPKCNSDCSMMSDRDCRFCGGNGKAFEDYTIDKVNCIAGKYLTLMSVLKDVVLYIAKSSQPVRFTFAGGDGLIMPNGR